MRAPLHGIFPDRWVFFSEMAQLIHRLIAVMLTAVLVWGCSSTGTLSLPDTDPKELRSKLRKQLRKNRDNQKALSLMGVLSVSQGKHQEGLHYLNRAAALDPKNLEIRKWQGKAYLAKGDVKKALDVF